jgi:hypothetical protein
MTELHVVSLEEVRALVAERQRYDDWLAALEAKRADTPPRVFERVYGDYIGRRGDVLARLQAHVGRLTALGDELDQRLADLDAQLRGHEDEMAEGALRNLVGEYDGDRWDAERRDIEGKMAALNEHRGALLAEFDEVRSLFASARVIPEPAGEPVSMPSDALPPAEWPTPEAEAVASEGMVASTALEETAAGDDSIFVVASDTAPEILVETVEEPVAAPDDEPLELDTPVPTSGPAIPSTTPDAEDVLALFGESAGDSAPQSEVDEDPFDDLAFLRSAPEPEAVADTGLTAPPAVSPDGGTAPAMGQGGGAAEHSPQNTLRCTECGTMNSPTEWYCERCGGELAAL